MTAETIHTCSYECERPGCIRAQRDYLAAQLTAAQQPAAPSEEAGGFDANFLRHIASVCRGAYDLCQPKPQRTPEDVREYNGGLCLSELANIADEIERRLAAPSGKAGDGCHCATCTCNPNMTPAVRFDLSPAQQEGVIRDHLIRLGWTPPEQRAEIEKLRAEVEAWRELSDHVHAGACKAIWPDRYIDERIRDVAAALKRAERLAEALRHQRWCRTCAEDGWESCEEGRKNDALLRDQESE